MILSAIGRATLVCLPDAAGAIEPKVPSNARPEFPAPRFFGFL
jgi:hypothetical protein